MLKPIGIGASLYVLAGQPNTNGTLSIEFCNKDQRFTAEFPNGRLALIETTGLKVPVRVAIIPVTILDLLGNDMFEVEIVAEPGVIYSTDGEEYDKVYLEVHRSTLTSFLLYSRTLQI